MPQVASNVCQGTLQAVNTEPDTGVPFIPTRARGSSRSCRSEDESPMPFLKRPSEVGRRPKSPAQ